MSTHIVFSVLEAVCFVHRNKMLLWLPSFCSPALDSLTASYAYLTEFHTRPWNQQEQVIGVEERVREHTVVLQHLCVAKDRVVQTKMDV
jgi:hypothetical protein